MFPRQDRDTPFEASSGLMPCRNSSNSNPRVYGRISPPMTNRNPRSGKLAFLLITFVILAGFQPGSAKAQDAEQLHKWAQDDPQDIERVRQAIERFVGGPQGIEQLRRAAEQGVAEAQFMLGAMHRFELGAPKDDQEAAKWYQKAAEQGFAGGQYGLAIMYLKGEGVPLDYRAAAKWYRRAAEQGVAAAQNDLGAMYDKGTGMPEDDREAAKWYRRAAEQGVVEAQISLAVMHSSGAGVPEDYVKAYAWLNLAAAQGEKAAIEGKDILRPLMTAEQVSEAQKLSTNLFNRIESSKSQ